MNYRRRRNGRRRDYRGPIISPRSLRVRQLSTRSRAEGREQRDLPWRSSDGIRQETPNLRPRTPVGRTTLRFSVLGRVGFLRGWWFPVSRGGSPRHSAGCTPRGVPPRRDVRSSTRRSDWPPDRPARDTTCFLVRTRNSRYSNDSNTIGYQRSRDRKIRSNRIDTTLQASIPSSAVIRDWIRSWRRSSGTKGKNSGIKWGVVFDATSSTIGALTVILIINQAQCLMRFFHSDCG